jgi:hypothetical protein
MISHILLALFAVLCISPSSFAAYYAIQLVKVPGFENYYYKSYVLVDQSSGNFRAISTPTLSQSTEKRNSNSYNAQATVYSGYGNYSQGESSETSNQE